MIKTKPHVIVGFSIIPTCKLLVFLPFHYGKLQEEPGEALRAAEQASTDLLD